jgi:solute:Na+ symporter, SSS family
VAVRRPRPCGRCRLLWVGTVAILAGQLIGIAWILSVVIGTPKIVGCSIGAIVVTVYFGAGGLMSSAIVNVVQRR